MSRALSDLAFHARSEPGLHEVLGRTNGMLAVPEVARPVILAALAHATTRTPLIVAVPTGTIAQQLAEDLAAGTEAFAVGADHERVAADGEGRADGVEDLHLQEV